VDGSLVLFTGMCVTLVIHEYDSLERIERKMFMDWQDPPETRQDAKVKKTGKYGDFAAELRLHPGQWARLPGKKAASMVTAIMNGHYTDFRPAGAFEATARGIDPVSKQASVFVRYIGFEGEEFAV
jgi:hypothetical protein